MATKKTTTPKTKSVKVTVTKSKTVPKKPVKKSTVRKVTYPTIRRGSEGDLVIQAQDLMSKDGSTVKVDGIFGGGTQSAVRGFQRRHKLPVDGIIGPETWAALIKIK